MGANVLNISFININLSFNTLLIIDLGLLPYTGHLPIRGLPPANSRESLTARCPVCTGNDWYPLKKGTPGSNGGTKVVPPSRALKRGLPK